MPLVIYRNDAKRFSIIPIYYCVTLNLFLCFGVHQDILNRFICCVTGAYLSNCPLVFLSIIFHAILLLAPTSYALHFPLLLQLQCTSHIFLHSFYLNVVFTYLKSLLSKLKKKKYYFNSIILLARKIIIIHFEFCTKNTI